MTQMKHRNEPVNVKFTGFLPLISDRWAGDEGSASIGGVQDKNKKGREGANPHDLCFSEIQITPEYRASNFT